MKLLYIASDNRSGSTLLDMLIAGHSRVTTLGEAHQLRAYALQDPRYYPQSPGDRPHDMVCYCGETLQQCPFWTRVEQVLGEPLGNLELKLATNRPDLQGRPLGLLYKKLLWWLFNGFPSLYERDAVQRLVNAPRVARDSIRLYQAVAEVSGCDYVLDSSKLPHRMYALAGELRGRMKVILLCRDFKGTVYSKMKRGIPLWKGGLHWRWTAEQMARYSRALPQADVLRVRYEDLCDDLEAEMRRICDFLSLDYEPGMLARDSSDMHHLGGSPSKYRGAGDHRVQRDLSYEEGLSSRQRALLYRLVRRQAEDWGYSR